MEGKAVGVRKGTLENDTIFGRGEELKPVFINSIAYTKMILQRRKHKGKEKRASLLQTTGRRKA